MKLLTIVFLTVLVFGVTSRRLNHLSSRSALQHFGDDIQVIEKRIFRDVLTDKDITQLISEGKTGDENFKTTILKKTLSIIGGNDEYLKGLASKIFEGASFNVNEPERVKIVQNLLKDETALNSIIGQKQNETLKRITQLIHSDNQLVQNIGKDTKLDGQNKLSDAQKVALFKIYLNNPSLIGKQSISSQQLPKILQQIQNDNDLKEFYGQNDDNKKYIKDLLNKNR